MKQNASMDASPDAEGAKAIPLPAPDRRRPRRSESSPMAPAIAAAACVYAAAIGLRAWLAIPPGGALAADWVRLLSAAALVFYALGAAIIPGRFKTKRTPLPAGKKWIPRSIAVILGSLALGWADLQKGGACDSVPFAMLALALATWERSSRYLYLATLLGASIAAMAFAAGRGGDLALHFLSLGSILAGFVAARSIRDYMLPGAERLKALESENKELWNLSFRDGLTGLYNRRYAQEGGTGLYNRASKFREQLHAIMLDIDHFKKVNDELSHAVGDIVLKGIAASLLQNLRGSDICARWGGEEFLIFLPGAEPELAQSIANRIRNAVETLKFPEVPWKVTASLGITGLRGDDSLESLIDRADRYLYESKRNGRNRVTGS